MENEKIAELFKGVWTLTISVFLASTLFPFYCIRIEGPDWFSLQPTSCGFISYIYGGWIAFIFFIIFYYSLYKHKISAAQKYGTLGCLFLGFNLFIFIPISISQDILCGMGFRLGLIAWILFCGLTVSLFFIKNKLRINGKTDLKE